MTSTLTKTRRIRPGHFRQRHREPRRDDPLHRNDAQVLSSGARARKGGGRGCQSHDRQGHQNRGYRRQGKDRGGGRRCCERAGQHTQGTELKRLLNMDLGLDSVVRLKYRKKA